MISATGEIDRLTAPRWRRTLTAATRLAPTRTDPGPGSGGAGDAVQRLVADLSAVTFLAAGGIGVLVEVAELSARRGVDLRVVASSRPVRRLLGLTGLDRQLVVGTRLDHEVADELSHRWLHDPAPVPGDVAEHARAPTLRDVPASRDGSWTYSARTPRTAPGSDVSLSG